MADIFTKPDVVKLLKNKHIVFLGDSNTRPLYKDIVCLLNRNSFISNADLRRKLEPSFMGDKLLKGDKLTRGRDYEEVRKFKGQGVHLQFYFITKCYNKYIEELVNQVKNKCAPDVIVMNSVLWDITRWGPNGVEQYRDNLVRVMKLFKQHLPPDTLLVWNTAPPISKDCYGGTLIKQIDFLKHTLRFEVMEANMFARDVVGVHGFHVLDMHYYLRMHMLKRAADGIHWLPAAVRYMTNLLLTHIALSFDEPLPGNWDGPLLQEMVERMKLPAEGTGEVALPAVPAYLLEDPTPAQKVVPSPFRSPFRKPATARTHAPGPSPRWKRLRNQENVPPCLVTPKLKQQKTWSSETSPSLDRSIVPRPLVHSSVLKPVNAVRSNVMMKAGKSCGGQLRNGRDKENHPSLLSGGGGRVHHGKRESQLPPSLHFTDEMLRNLVLDTVLYTWEDILNTCEPQVPQRMPMRTGRSMRRPMPY